MDCNPPSLLPIVPCLRCTLENLSAKKILIDSLYPEDRHLSLIKHRSLSARIAVTLQRLGIEPKGRSSYRSGSSATYSAVLMGTIMSGCTFVMGQPGYGPRRIVDRNLNGDKWVYVPSRSIGYYQNPDTTSEYTNHGVGF
ncbi:hypothetical protein N7476_001630 [Penicillium atrosanguineum]|uniref:Uncharacterized protein n=1 Tax=Penicillium atrosanguineum TaxID=1132637 RepID=A0A9W9UCT7_9EURO|nr:hypothetical protein N7476_001630 [Penicillium atrosanguineum]